jgi:exopolysaccharide biosynthesis WecB/TagA/CpsF family protein
MFGNGRITMSSEARMAAAPRRRASDLPRRDILGIRVAVSRAQDALEHLDARLQVRAPTCVGFLNAHASNLASSDPEFARSLQGWLILNDGIGVDLASRVLHRAPFPENLNGTDFVPRFFRETRHVLRIFLLGGEPGIADRAEQEFRRIAPRHVYVGCRDGYFAERDVPAIIETLRAARVDVLLIGLGTPTQEMWVAEHFLSTECGLALCVGGLLDFDSGAKPRAPLWLRRARLEWAYRLFLEPRRLWRRYLVGNPRFMLRVAAAMVGRRLAGLSAAPPPSHEGARRPPGERRSSAAGGGFRPPHERRAADRRGHPRGA